MALGAFLTIQSCGKKFLGFRYDPKAELSLEEIEFVQVRILRGQEYAKANQ